MSTMKKNMLQKIFAAWKSLAVTLLSVAKMEKESVSHQVPQFISLTGLKRNANLGIAPLFLNGKRNGHLVVLKNAVMNVSNMSAVSMKTVLL